MAFYEAFIGRISSSTCLHDGTKKEMAEHLLLSCLRWELERQRHFGESTAVPGLLEPVEIYRLFRASPYRYCLTGSSQQQQQSNYIEQ